MSKVGTEVPKPASPEPTPRAAGKGLEKRAGLSTKVKSGSQIWAEAVHGPLADIISTVNGTGGAALVSDPSSAPPNSDNGTNEFGCVVRTIDSDGKVTGTVSRSSLTKGEHCDEKLVLESDHLLGTPFHCERAALVALAAVGVEAVGINAARGADTSSAEILIEPRIAAAAIRQDRYVLRDGESAKLWNEVSGLYLAGDGRHIQLHCNFSNHRNAALRVLNISPRKGQERGELRDKISAAIRACNNAFDLEEAMESAGACAAVVRTPEEWSSHPQQHAVSSLAPVTIEEVSVDGKFADRSTRQFSQDPHHPVLQGIKIVDMSRVLAGPMAGRTLADFGATVVRVSSPDLPSIENLVLATGHGKTSSRFRFQNPNELAEFKELVKGADIVINAYRPGCLDRFGLSSHALARDFPGLIVVELSAFSHVGPWRFRRGFDSLIQCVTGLVHEQSENRNLPQHLPVQVLDYVTGYLGAACAMQALVRRQQRPYTSFIARLSLCQTAEWVRSLGRKSMTGAGALWREALNVPAEALSDHLIETALSGLPTDFNGTRTLTSLDIPFQLKGCPTPKLGSAPVPLGTPLTADGQKRVALSNLLVDYCSDDDSESGNSLNLEKHGNQPGGGSDRVDDARRKVARRAVDLPKFPAQKKAKSTHGSEALPMRIRNFPHVAGNWPTFFSIDVAAPPKIAQLSADFLRNVEKRLRPTSCKNSIFMIERPHLSLSRTFPVRQHEIEPLFNDVCKALLPTTRPFSASFRGFKLYFSENKSRLFVAAVLDRGKRSTIQAINCVDAALKGYAKPLFYDDPEPHVSLCWIDLDSSVDAPNAVHLMASLAKLEPEAALTQFTVHIEQARGQAGDKVRLINFIDK